MKQRPTIAVVGSLNLDFTLRVPNIPAPGETMMATGAQSFFGGKGANQAVAATRAGGQVFMIGSVGEDEHGDRYCEHLRREGVDVAGVVPSQVAPTGAAFITVDEVGENTIVVHPGANDEFTAKLVDERSSLFEGIDAILLQLECPLPAVAKAMELARAAGATVILNPSPWRDAARELCARADVLIINETEARALAEDGKFEKVSALRDEVGCETLIVTRGAKATRVASDRPEHFEVTPPTITPVDTVGAGDTFAGFFAVAHAEGQSLLDSVKMANMAAALATLKPGAQEAIPRREVILAALEQSWD